VTAVAEFPVIPVEAGIFAFSPDKFRYGTANAEANQAVAGQFPWRPKREFQAA
jgi:hypothetical protein